MVNFFNDLNLYLNFKLISIEEIIIIFLFYNFIKVLIFGSVFELIWPTQFFNRRHCNKFFKVRSFTESILKLKNNNSYYNTFNLYILNYFFLRK